MILFFFSGNEQEINKVNREIIRKKYFFLNDKNILPPFLDKYSTKPLLKISSLKIPSNHNLFYLLKNKLITKNDFIPISLNYDVVNAGALGTLGRRFESCRPDSSNPSKRRVSKPVFLLVEILHIGIYVIIVSCARLC